MIGEIGFSACFACIHCVFSLIRQYTVAVFAMLGVVSDRGAATIGFAIGFVSRRIALKEYLASDLKLTYLHLCGQKNNLWL